MANNYIEFSVEIPYANEEQHQWLLLELRKYDGLSCWHCGMTEEEEDVSQDHHNEQLDHDFQNWEEGSVCAFEDYPKDKAVWCSTEESGDLGVLAQIVCKYQYHFGLTEPWYAEQAFICDKPRIGEFGGNAVLCYRGQEYWCNPLEALQEKFAQLQAEED